MEQNCDENDWCVRSPLTLRGVLCPTTGRTCIGLDDDATLPKPMSSNRAEIDSETNMAKL